MPAETHEKLVDVDVIAGETNIKRNTVYRMALDRKIPSVKVGKMRRFYLSKVMAALNAYEVAVRPSR